MSSSHIHSDPPHRDDDEYTDDDEYVSSSDDEYTDDDRSTSDSDDDDYDPNSESESEDEWINATWFDKPKYAVANMSSNLTVNDIKFMKSIYLIPEEYTCILPKPTHKIYETQVLDGHIGIGLSKYAFKCGLRFPLHPFYDEILDDAKIGLGQLLPNSFLQVNSFIDRCPKRCVDLQLRLFWHHYQLTTSAKASGFFSLGLKPGSQQWIDPSGNNRGSHEAWFYLFGPDMEFYMDWRDYTPNKNNPKLNDNEKLDYKELTKNHDSSMKMSSAMLRDEKFLNEDPEKLSKMSSLSCGGEVRAFASQLYLWSLEQEEKSRLELARLAQLGDAADAAENRATDEMQKAALAEAKVIQLEKSAKETAIREEKLKEKISSLEKQLHEAKEAKIKAEANWLRGGLNRRLDMVKAANLDSKNACFHMS